ncbi:unnamed protein product [Ectocarpus sp. CCAP 1310/34]|nr:unnamed protein product [Ectocarpus sp. CCAP 1310/34]
MFRCANAFVNYRECSGWVKGIGGNNAPVPPLGYGDVTVVFLTEGGRVPVLILNAAHVPESPHNLLSLSALAEEGHTYSGQKGGLTLTTRAGGKVWFPRPGKLLTQEGYQIEPKVDIACAATIVPGDAKAATPTDLNSDHNSHGHTHEELLQKTAKQQGVQLTGGPLLPCLGCSMSKGQVKPISKSTDTRAANKLFRLFLNLGGRMQFKSIGGNWYTLIIRDDCTRWTRVFFLKHKSDAAAAFEQYLADYRAETVPCEVFVARTDGGGEFQGQFAEVCRRSGIKQEFTPPNTPKYNGVAERALGLLADSALASRIQAKEMFPDAPVSPGLWAEAISCACHQMNCTATTGNPGHKSPEELFHGTPPPVGSTHPFLKPLVFKSRRKARSQPRARKDGTLGLPTITPVTASAC